MPARELMQQIMKAGPFIHFDGRTIYFMRDGPNGYGGSDFIEQPVIELKVMVPLLKRKGAFFQLSP